MTGTEVVGVNGYPTSALGVPGTLPELLQQRAVEAGARIAGRFLADGETESLAVSYAGLDHWARAVGGLLQTVAAPGDRVLLLYPPGLEFLGAFLGVLYGGMSVVVLHPPHPARREQFLSRAAAVLRDAAPTAALTTTTLSDALTGMAAAHPMRVVTWSATDAMTAAAGWRNPCSRPADIAFLQYTSGSTSEPKGVIVTHGNLVANLQAIHGRFGPADGDGTSVAWLPPYHDMGLIGGMLAPLYFNSPVTLLPPLAFVQRPRRWLEAISATRARISGGPSFAYDLCVRKITPAQRDQLDLRCWEVAFNGAEPVDPRTLAAFAEYFAPAGFDPRAFKPCYGLAESTLMVSAVGHAAGPTVAAFLKSDLVNGVATPCHGAAPGGRMLASSGPPVSPVVIVDPDALTECRDGRVGEIWVSGPSVAAGYWNRHDDTRDTFQARVAGTGNGPFLRTGDLGFLLEGELYVTGRLKDLIILDGQNHYPQDIERTVARVLPSLGLGECAAFSVDREGTEALVVIIGLGGRASLGADEARRLVRTALSEHHDLRVADIVLTRTGRIPRTPSGKVRRRLCRAMYLDGTLMATEDR